MADLALPGHAATAPLRGVLWVCLQRLLHHGVNGVCGQRRDTPSPREVSKKSHRAGLLETFPPQHDRWPGGVQLSGNGVVRLTGDGQQHHVAAEHYALLGRSCPRPVEELLFLQERGWKRGGWTPHRSSVHPLTKIVKLC